MKISCQAWNTIFKEGQQIPFEKGLQAEVVLSGNISSIPSNTKKESVILS